jgi:hypothetical protein
VHDEKTDWWRITTRLPQQKVTGAKQWQNWNAFSPISSTFIRNQKLRIFVRWKHFEPIDRNVDDSSISISERE